MLAPTALHFLFCHFFKLTYPYLLSIYLSNLLRQTFINKVLQFKLTLKSYQHFFFTFRICVSVTVITYLSALTIFFKINN